MVTVVTVLPDLEGVRGGRAVRRSIPTSGTRSNTPSNESVHTQKELRLSTTSDKENATKKGVESAWDFWLGQHDYSVPATIEAAIVKAFSEWLEDHTEDLIEAIATKVADKRSQA